MASVETATNRFSDKLLGLLDRIEYRRVETGEDMEDVARIRYKAYKAGAVMHLDEQAVLRHIALLRIGPGLLVERRTHAGIDDPVAGP